MQVENRFLWLFREVAVGDHIDGWRVCWTGGSDKGRVLFVVMVERALRAGSKGACAIIRRPTQISTSIVYKAL
jgi:hypothetical protein